MVIVDLYFSRIMNYNTLWIFYKAIFENWHRILTLSLYFEVSPTNTSHMNVFFTKTA